MAVDLEWVIVYLNCDVQQTQTTDTDSLNPILSVYDEHYSSKEGTNYPSSLN